MDNSLGNRMKEYENTWRQYLPRRMACILRLDGCHFHAFTRGFNKPYDTVLAEAMRALTIKLCENIAGVKFGYTTSDEISLLLSDVDTLETIPWFGKNIQKMVSVAASMAGYYFKDLFYECADKAWENRPANKESTELIQTHLAALEKGPIIFDCRAFVLPWDDVANYFYWREQESIYNSISALAQMHFTQKELNGKTCYDMCQMLHSIGHDWEATSLAYQRGVSARKRPYVIPNTTIERRKWVIDTEIPIFCQNPEYILGEIPGLGDINYGY